MQFWTAERVKRELPCVKMRVSKSKVVDGRLSGRLNAVATVTIHNGLGIGTNPPWVDFHFAWEAIAYSLNSGKPLTF